METHISIFAWNIPWTEEPGRLHSMELPRAGHDCACMYIYRERDRYRYRYYFIWQLHNLKVIF